MAEQLRRPESFTHETVNLDGVNIHYVVEGSGDPLLLVHGWPGFWWEWHRNIPELANDFMVIVPDMRGYGDSDKPNLNDFTLYSLDHTSDDLAKLLDHLGIGEANLVGHDWSSLVLHKFVRAHPEHSRKLLMCDPVLPGVEFKYYDPSHFPESWYPQFFQTDMSVELVGHSRETIEIFFRHFFSHWSSDPNVFTDEEIDIYVDNFMKKDNVWGGFNWYRANLAMTSKPWSKLDRTPSGIESRFLWGMDDSVVDINWSDYISDWYYNYTFRPLPGVGHFVMREATDILNQEIREFFKR